MNEPYYADDLVTLYYGDCLDIMAELPEASVDTVLTDPPYSSGGRRENSRSLRKSMTRRVEDDDWIRGDAMSTPGFVYLLRQCGVEWRRVLRPGGHVLSFIDWRMGRDLPQSARVHRSYDGRDSDAAAAAPNLGAALETADLRQHPTLLQQGGWLLGCETARPRHVVWWCRMSEKDAWRVRPTHDVTMYGGRSTPCFCYADQSHTVGQEVRVTSPGVGA